MANETERICITVLHELRDVFGRRFHLADSRERGYPVWVERGLGFRVCSGEDVLVHVQPTSPVGWLVWEWPRRLDVVLSGEHRGFIRRPRLTPFRRDVLTLDGREHPIPRWLEQGSGPLGVELYWGAFGSKPVICIPREEDLLVGLLILTYVYVRAMALEG